MKNTISSNKLLKRQRITRYFIDAAREIVEEEGVHAVTIRSVAERAGYNSATLYNYFENLDQLIAFVCIDSISGMIEHCSELNRREGDFLGRYLQSWRDFCEVSFSDPEIYEYIYFSDKSDLVLGSYAAYLEVFPEKKDEIDEVTLGAYLQKTFYEQEIYSVEICVKDGFFRQQDVESIATLVILLYRGLLTQFIMPNNRMTVEEAVKAFMHFFVSYIQPRLLKEKDLSQYIIA